MQEEHGHRLLDLQFNAFTKSWDYNYDLVLDTWSFLARTLNLQFACIDKDSYSEPADLLFSHFYSSHIISRTTLFSFLFSMRFWIKITGRRRRRRRKRWFSWGCWGVWNFQRASEYLSPRTVSFSGTWGCKIINSDTPDSIFPLGMMMMNHNMLLISFLLQLKWLLQWQKHQEKETQF